jgi:hypothetical protein
MQFQNVKGSFNYLASYLFLFLHKRQEKNEKKRAKGIRKEASRQGKRERSSEGKHSSNQQGFSRFSVSIPS